MNDSDLRRQQEILTAMGMSDIGDAEILHARILAGVKLWREEVDLTTSKIITCGVAATHPDANLSRTKAYGGKWDSPQAQRVRKVRDERDALASLLTEALDELFEVTRDVDRQRSETEAVRKSIKDRANAIVELSK